jgi:general secretion pathway protein E
MTSRPRELPFAYASHHGVLLDGATLWHRAGVAVAVWLELQRQLPAFEPRALTNDAFQRRLTEFYQRDTGEASRVAADLDSDRDLAQLAQDLPDSADLMEGADDAPVIRLINAILAQAVREKASDIHIEPDEKHLAVRCRIDGVLADILRLELKLAPLLVSRIKVMARLDIAERRLPQDGRISVRLAGHAVDIRVSTIPAAHGERVVLRLLDKQGAQFDMDGLQMPAPVLAGLRRALARPHGMLLVTGPTGSGKTTTLYAGLTALNDRSRNILTIEDPVEYLLPGVGQMQVNSKIDMSFARGLRALLRQDPDVVMVGEIRDSETASIAIQASLTGHLVLSTLHTNTAIGAVTRLQDMGVEPFLLASSLVGVMAQRLVRQLCGECRQPLVVTAELAARLLLPEGAEIFGPQGCAHCKQSGYRGRTGLYEWIEIDETLARLIHAGGQEPALREHCRGRYPSLLEHGRARILAGETSVEEVLRVTAAD